MNITITFASIWRICRRSGTGSGRQTSAMPPHRLHWPRDIRRRQCSPIANRQPDAMEAGTHQAVALNKDGSVTFSGADARTGLSTKERMSIFALLLFLLFFACIELERLASAQQPGASTPLVNAPLSGEQVVENLVAMNLKRALALHSYQGTRLYQIEYHGFPGTRSARWLWI